MIVVTRYPNKNKNTWTKFNQLRKSSKGYACSDNNRQRFSYLLNHPNFENLHQPINHISLISSFSTSSLSSSDNNDSDDPNKSYKLTLKQRKALKLLHGQPTSTTSSSDTIHSQTDLSQILVNLREQSLLQDIQNYQSNPQPWYYLLTYPSRALWRSSPKLPPSYLTNEQYNILHKKTSGRTMKQLKRTMDSIVKNHLDLSTKRERERRNLVNNNSHHDNSSSSTSLHAKQQRTIENKIKPVYYKPEQTLCSLKYRLVPNYNITKRILREIQGLLGKDVFQPKKVLDVGMGVGSSSAAVLDYAYERFDNQNRNRDTRGSDNSSNNSTSDYNINAENENDANYSYSSVDDYNGIEWIHGIDPSLSMRDGAQRILKSVIEGQQEELLQSMNGTDNSHNQQTMQHPRITLGEVLSSSISSIDNHRDVSKSKGSFDLALCTYTLCEVPNVAASLALAVMIWEKLSPNGIAIFIEPGTPDGFNSLRSVRSMLLDCCPPLKNRDGSIIGSDDDDDLVAGGEECHVIAPCTHNGTCPMVRHQRFFFKDKKEKDGIDETEDDNLNNDEEDRDFEDELDDDDEDNGGWEEQEYDDDDGWGGDDGGWEEYDKDWDENDDQWDNATINKSSSSLSSQNTSNKHTMTNETNAFNTSFCSFVHGMPGGEHGKRGEKFTYLVVQKRLTGEGSGNESFSQQKQQQKQNKDDPFHDIDLVNLLSQSINSSGIHSKQTLSSSLSSIPSKAQHQYPKAKDNPNVKELLLKAVDIETKFINSDEDKLGLELVKGKFHSWGRIIRAPIKKKGHVFVDYCTSISVDNDSRSSHNELDAENDDDDDHNNQLQERGKIIRQKVTRSQSERAAPGLFLAARKSRWGGLWPDVEKSNKR